MNIFVTNPCPVISAQNLDDKRVIKMILESAQMLSAAMNLRGLKGPYKNTHVNHPCTIWARTTRKNYLWLTDHFIALCHEYSRRYKREHKCYPLKDVFIDAQDAIPEGDLTPFANCTPHKQIETIKAYKITMEEKWAVDKRKPNWKTRSKPTWQIE